MHKPVAIAQDVNSSAFLWIFFQSSGRPLSLGGWGAHQAGFCNKIYQGVSTESQKLILFHEAMLVLLWFFWAESLGQRKFRRRKVIGSCQWKKDSEVHSPLENWISLTLRRVTLLFWECSWWGGGNGGVRGSTWCIDKKEHTGKNYVVCSDLLLNK